MSVQQIKAEPKKNAEVLNLADEIRANQKKQMTLPDLIQKSLNELDKALPAHLNAERMVRIALTTIRLNPELSDCTQASFLGALFSAAQLGLEPNVTGQCFIVPFKNDRNENGRWRTVKEAQLIIGYQGLVELFYRHESSVSIDAHAVYENDFFEYKYGTGQYLNHIPAKKERGKVVEYYVIAKLANEGETFKVMSKEDCIEHGQKHSKCYNKEKQCFNPKTPWATETDAQCKKTVLIQLSKWLPKSSEIRKAIAMDNTTKTLLSTDMSELRDETNWNDRDSNELRNKE